MGLARGARYSVEVESVFLVRNQRRWYVGVVVFLSRSKSHVSLAASWLWVGGRWLTQVPLTNLAIFRARQKEVGRRFDNDPLDPIGMTAINSDVGIPRIQVARIVEKVVKPSAPCRCRKGRRGVDAVAAIAGIFDVKDTNLGITGASHQSSIVGVWHKFDREDVRAVARRDGGIQREWCGGRIGLIGIDVQVLVVRARS